MLHNVSNSVQLDPDNKRIQLTCTVQMTFPVEGEEEPMHLASIGLDAAFEIPDIDAYVLGEGAYRIPKGASGQMLGIAIGSTRGALAALGSGSVLDVLPLPVVEIAGRMPLGDYPLGDIRLSIFSGGLKTKLVLLFMCVEFGAIAGCAVGRATMCSYLYRSDRGRYLATLA